MNGAKSACVTFALLPGNWSMVPIDDTCYLGVHQDGKLIWRAHIKVPARGTKPGLALAVEQTAALNLSPTH
uniref:AT11392p n=1 Tax=Drosophila melanogaster TaxID=7227 RepID=Q8MZD4_DROME|nr:AT11392p [Drosophila melanogaster]